jgi:hypothetical protein
VVDHRRGEQRAAQVGVHHDTGGVDGAFQLQGQVILAARFSTSAPQGNCLEKRLLSTGIFRFKNPGSQVESMAAYGWQGSIPIWECRRTAWPSSPYLEDAVNAGELFQLGLFVFIHGLGSQSGVGLIVVSSAFSMAWFENFPGIKSTRSLNCTGGYMSILRQVVGQVAGTDALQFKTGVESGHQQIGQVDDGGQGVFVSWVSAGSW